MLTTQDIAINLLATMKYALNSRLQMAPVNLFQQLDPDLAPQKSAAMLSTPTTLMPFVRLIIQHVLLMVLVV